MRATACTHLRTELRWKSRTANMIGRQRLDCLTSVTGANWLAHDKAVQERGSLDGMADWDELQLPLIKAAGYDSAGEAERFVDSVAYREYMASPAWGRRRAKVMERARGTCEGCLTKPAEHVHHRSYAHFGAEFAFELLALCEDCHSRWHRSTKL